MNTEPLPQPRPVRGLRPAPAGGKHPAVTRAGMAWVSPVTALALLILLIAFIVQNQDNVRVRFFALEGTISPGMALFIAAVGGGVLVAVAAAVRIIQLRSLSGQGRTTPTGTWPSAPAGYTKCVDARIRASRQQQPESQAAAPA
jgi:uncharacterized integral membrane protein